jgi:hypothetical protein
MRREGGKRKEAHTQEGFLFLYIRMLQGVIWTQKEAASGLS